MTTPKTAYCIIVAQAIAVEIEAMLAANKERDRRGEAQAYSEDAFSPFAQRLYELASEAINQCEGER